MITSKTYTILYCPTTLQYLGYSSTGDMVSMEVNRPGIAKDVLMPGLKPNMMNLTYPGRYDYLYDTNVRLIVPKPKYIITDVTSSVPDPKANGEDYYTVTVGFIDSDGEPIPMPAGKNKDEAFISEISNREISAENNTFKVRSRIAGKAKIRILEPWDGSTTAMGAPFLKYGMAYVELLFKINSGW